MRCDVVRGVTTQVHRTEGRLFREEDSSSSFPYFIRYRYLVSRDSSVGIAIRYGLDGPGIEFRCGAMFSPPVQTGLL